MSLQKAQQYDTDTRPHWGLFVLAHYEEDNEPGVTSSQLYKLCSGIFDSKMDVAAVLSDLGRQKELADREKDYSAKGRPYRYKLNEDGREMLQSMGLPETVPATGESPNRDLNMPSTVVDNDQNSGPELVTDDEPDEVDREDPGPFESAKARRRFFAQKERQDYLDWLENEHKPKNKISEDELENEKEEMEATVNGDEPTDSGFEPGADHEGEVQFEGMDEVMDDFFTDDESFECDHCPRMFDTESAMFGHQGNCPEKSKEPEIGRTVLDPDTNSPPIGEREPDIPDTIDLSPDWDWVGTQLVKLGFPMMAKRAYMEKMSPEEVYGTVIDLIHESRDDERLDLESGPSGLTVYESDTDPAEVSRFKDALGVA